MPDTCIGCNQSFGVIRYPGEPDNNLCLECTIAVHLVNSSVIGVIIDAEGTELIGLDGNVLPRGARLATVEERKRVLAGLAELLVSDELKRYVTECEGSQIKDGLKPKKAETTDWRRKRVEERRTTHVMVYFSPKEREEVLASAKLHNMETVLSAFIRWATFRFINSEPMYAVDESPSPEVISPTQMAASLTAEAVSPNKPNVGSDRLPLAENLISKLKPQLESLFEFVVQQHQQAQTACSSHVLDCLPPLLEMIDEFVGEDNSL